MILWFSFLAVGLALFGAGFVLGIAYGVHREEEAEVERMLRAARYR